MTLYVLACVNCVRWSYSGKYLASGGDDKLVMVWTFVKSPSGLEIFVLIPHVSSLNILCKKFVQSLYTFHADYWGLTDYFGVRVANLH